MLVWFVIGMICGIGVALVVPYLGRRVPVLRARRYLVVGGIIAVVATAAVVYIAASPGSSAPPRAMAPPSPAAPSAATPAAKSMEAEIASLETRLARDGGSAADWTLLERAYVAIGRPQDAQRARSHVSNPGAVPFAPLDAETLTAAAASFGAATGAANAAAPSPATPVSATDLEHAVQANPADVQSWLALADLRRTQRDYQRARTALDKVIALHAMSAQSWADYADVSASLAGGSLDGQAGIAIDNALALDPTNPKALWLKASQAHQQRRYAQALSWWRKLRAALPPDSSDTGIIDSNIAEDAALANAVPAAAATPQAGAGVEISGTVSIDSRFANRVPASATLFIYAKSADSPGAPLAVIRLTAGAWPVSFRLDDSMAMIPSRRLSQFANVVVEARISRSGGATPSSGDLYTTSPVLHRGAKKLALVIDREIG